MQDVTGYYIHARDGDIGHVEDFLISTPDWAIRYLIVDTKKLVAGQTCAGRADLGVGYQLVGTGRYP